jgi:macrolide-specific efflux system membrane fusion protein
MLNTLTRHFPRGRRHAAVAYGILSVALVTAGTLAYGAITPTAASTTSNSRIVTAQMGTVTQSVSATGNVQPVTTLNVGFATPGTVSEVDVKVGQQLKAGDVIAKLDPTLAQVNLRIAQLNLTSAQAKLASALAGTPSPTTAASSGPQGSTSAAATAQPTTTTTAAPVVDPSAVASAEASVLQAGTAVTAAQKAVDATVLTAPSPGTVTTLSGLVGQAVSGSGTSAASTASAPSSAASGSAAASTSSTPAFLTLIDTSAVIVRVGFAEVDAVKVTAGQPATITIAALPGTQLTGTVISIDPTSTVVSNVVTYYALMSVAGPPPTLKPGMTAAVNVQVANRPNVLAVPTAAIQTQGGASSVNLAVTGKPVPTPVTTGLQGDTSTEILSGLTAGQQLLVATGTTSSSAARTGTGAGFVPGAGGGGAGAGAGGAGAGAGGVTGVRGG